MTRLASIHFGDAIGFVSGSFALATPSLHDESITERATQQSGVRAIYDHSITTAGFQFPPDYADRCIFKILPDKNAIGDNRSVGEVCFGSIVRLIHEPTGHALIGSAVDHKQPGKENAVKKINCVFLRNVLTREEESASQWIVQSRYRLRMEGDAVRINDSIILKSLLYKDSFLTIPDYFTDETAVRSSTPAAFLPGPYYVGITSDSHKISSSGWLVKCFKRKILDPVNSINPIISNGNTSIKDVDHDSHILSTGCYIRITHIETGGHVICRADDSKALISKVAPLGSIFRLESGPRSETHGVYMRCPLTSSSSSSDPSHTDSLNVWQILPQITDGVDIFQKVSFLLNFFFRDVSLFF